MKRLFQIALVFAISVAANHAAFAALLITPTGTNNSTTTLTGGGGGDRAAQSALTLSAAGFNGGVITIGSTATTSTRYTSSAAADRGAATGGSTAVAQVNTNYTVNFAIADPGAGYLYDVDISAVIRGGLRARDDGVGGTSGGGLARITSITASNAALSVAYGGGQIQQGGTSNTSGVETGINDTRNTTISGLSGAQNISLTFTWATRAESPQNLIGGDEHAALFGINDIHGGNNTDNYPGTPARTQANDGHFVTATVRVTQVPEPSSALLALCGLVGMAGFRRRSV